MNTLTKQIRRLINCLIGSGPYGLVSFKEIAKSAHDESIYGIDHPESTTGILYKEDNKKWIEYSQPTLSLTEEIVSRHVEGRPRYLKTGLFPEPERIIYSLSNGGIASNSGLVYEAKTRLAIKETVHNWTYPPKYQPVLLAPRLPSPVYLEGVSLSLVTLGAEGFYHFFHESLPKLFLAKSLLHSIDHILINGGGEGWKTRWLKQAGVPIEKVIWIGGLCHYQCKQLLFVSDVVANEQPNSWSVTALRSLLGIPSSPKDERWIWASRADATSRQLAWEDAILQQFPKFERVCFSTLTPEQTIQICNTCKVFAGPHGAAFSNIVFCNPGSIVVEFSPHKFKNPSFTRLADICKLKHATAVVDFQDVPDRYPDLIVSLNSLLEPVDSCREESRIFPNIL